MRFQGYVTENGFYVLDTATGAVKLVQPSDSTDMQTMGDSDFSRFSRTLCSLSTAGTAIKLNKSTVTEFRRTWHDGHFIFSVSDRHNLQ